MALNVRRLSHPWLRREEAQQPLQPDNSACHGLCWRRCAPGTNRASLELPVKRMLERRSAPGKESRAIHGARRKGRTISKYKIEFPKNN